MSNDKLESVTSMWACPDEEKKGWCITEAEKPDSQTLRDCEDVKRDSKNYHSDPVEMEDLVCVVCECNAAE